MNDAFASDKKLGIMEGASLVVEADGLRADFAMCLRSIAGPDAALPASESAGAVASNSPGCEALVQNFLARAKRLHSAFAREATHGEEAEHSVASLRDEVDALRQELEAKESLLAAHRANVVRWKSECASVQGLCSQADVEP